MPEIKVKINNEDGVKEEHSVPLDQWTTDPADGGRVMYTRLKTIPICKNHYFNKQHECNRCPFIFVGFRANMHIQTEDGIFERKSGNKPGKRLA